MNFTDQDFLNAAVRLDFVTFLHRCMKTLNPGAPFLENWHIEAIAYQLELIRRGKTTRLIINMPPRALKSIIVSVGFQLSCWVMIRDARFLALAMGVSLPPSTPATFGRSSSPDGIAKPFPRCRSPAWRTPTSIRRLAAFERRRR